MKFETSIIKSLVAFWVCCLISACASVSRPTPPPTDRPTPPKDVESLVGQSALIFKGVVSGIAYETETESGLPFTYVTFRQLEPIKDTTRYAKSNKTLRIRLFGGLNYDGTMTISSHVPEFLLGAVYVVFHTAGSWDISPVAGGELGVFQVVKSRTLEHEILLDYNGHVVVGIDADGIQTLPLEDFRQSIQRPAIQSKETRVEQTDQVKISTDDSIYSEENVARIMQMKAERGADSSRLSLEQRQEREQERGRLLTRLAVAPLSMQDFARKVIEINERIDAGFLQKHSTLLLQGRSLSKERKPASLRQPEARQ
ncbi:MAG: hypothetical protein QNJ40_08805 [Xanthomonadales bacterium]|nr:hypothetical protein [Xanthomonadales bacterium]